MLAGTSGSHECSMRTGPSHPRNKPSPDRYKIVSRGGISGREEGPRQGFGCLRLLARSSLRERCVPTTSSGAREAETRCTMQERILKAKSLPRGSRWNWMRLQG